MKIKRNAKLKIERESTSANWKIRDLAIKFLCVVSTLSVFAGTLRADVTLVKDGAPVSDIVIAADAPRDVTLAAEDFQKHLKLISGAEVAIVNKPSADVSNHIYVGKSEFTDKLGFKPEKFDNSGLEILAKENHVILDGPIKQWKPSPYQQTRSDSRYLKSSIITGKVFPKPEKFPSEELKAWQDFCGEKFSTKHLNNAPGLFNKPLGIYVNNDSGPWYAVAELLEQLGVRWYMPYEDGSVIPEIKTITIPEQHLKKEARFAKREWRYYGSMRKDEEGISWLKRLKAGCNQIILYNHTTYAIYSSYEQQLAHPEYLAKDSHGNYIGGYPAGRGAPRYTNPGFRKAAVTFMNKVFESQPDLRAIAVGPPDGAIKIDPRDIDKYGKPGDSIEQKASNYVWDFHVYLANELKKSHPDKFLIFMTPTGARKLPTNIKDFPENLIVPPMIRPSSKWGLDAYRKARLKLLHEWTDKMKVVQKAPAWDHWLSYRTPNRPRYPVVFTKALQDQMQQCERYITGKFIEIQPEIKRDKEGKVITRRLGVRGLVHLMVYLQNKLFWNPDLDREKLLDEYYKLFFGPAENEMREFYEFSEKVWSRQESRSLTETTGFLKEKDVDKYFDILSRAREKAGTDTVYDRRIAIIEADMQPLKKLFPSLKRTGPWVRNYKVPEDFPLDGNIMKYPHNRPKTGKDERYPPVGYGWHKLREHRTGKRLNRKELKTVGTFVSINFQPKSRTLCIAAICYEPDMKSLVATATKNDDRSIFHDDVFEIYFDSPERSYFKVVVNTNGAIWDESTDVDIIDRDTLPILWNPGTKASVKKYDNRWEVEVRIPCDDLGKFGPSKSYPWGLEIGRTRISKLGFDNREAYSLVPTGGPYRVHSKWARMWMR
ncbi:MAG: DUF4838 domain-containing protein [Candidatus Rifleibacteriota bacterium]